MARTGLLGYVKAAFKSPYNLILFTGGLLAGVVSLQPHIVWPFVIAAEVLYLASLSSSGRFQAVVDARRAAEASRAANDPAPLLLERLDPARARRFEQVRRRCIDLQRSIAGEGQSSEPGELLAGQQAQGVNKLLWVFLRTLVQEQTLADFCATMPRREIEATLRETEAALADAQLSEEMKAAHGDNVQVLRLRLENLRRAEQNLAAIAARLVRVENSILLIQEQALTRRDPAFVEAEVRSVTEGLDSVEEMLRSMNLPQVETTSGDAVPEFLRQPGAGRERQRQ